MKNSVIKAIAYDLIKEPEIFDVEKLDRLAESLDLCKTTLRGYYSDSDFKYKMIRLGLNPLSENAFLLNSDTGDAIFLFDKDQIGVYLCSVYYSGELDSITGGIPGLNIEFTPDTEDKMISLLAYGSDDFIERNGWVQKSVKISAINHIGRRLDNWLRLIDRATSFSVSVASVKKLTDDAYLRISFEDEFERPIGGGGCYDMSDTYHTKVYIRKESTPPENIKQLALCAINERLGDPIIVNMYTGRYPTSQKFDLLKGEVVPEKPKPSVIIPEPEKHSSGFFDFLRDMFRGSSK